MIKVMILSLKERFRQSIVAMILFIKVMIAIHTMIIYITCKKTNWCTFSRSCLHSRTFFAFSPTLAHRLCGSSQQKSTPCGCFFYWCAKQDFGSFPKHSFFSFRLPFGKLRKLRPSLRSQLCLLPAPTKNALLSTDKGAFFE